MPSIKILSKNILKKNILSDNNIYKLTNQILEYYKKSFFNII